MNKEEMLLEHIASILGQYNLEGIIKFKQSRTAYFMWIRRIDKIRRHIWIRTLDENDLGWDYGIVYGEYPAWEDYPKGITGFRGFDSRSMGNLDFIKRFFLGWMIELKDWKNLPSAKEEYEKINPN